MDDPHILATNHWLRAVSGDRRISILHRIILMRICLHRDSDSGKCDPGYDAVGTELGVHRTTVIRAVEIGVRLGWLAPPIRGRREKANFVFTFPLTKQEVAPKGDFKTGNVRRGQAMLSTTQPKIIVYEDAPPGCDGIHWVLDLRKTYLHYLATNDPPDRARYERALKHIDQGIAEWKAHHPGEADPYDDKAWAERCKDARHSAVLGQKAYPPEWIAREREADRRRQESINRRAQNGGGNVVSLDPLTRRRGDDGGATDHAGASVRKIADTG